MAAGSDSNSESDNYLDKYKSAKKLVIRAKKLETKGKNEKALKLYNKAHKQLLEANKIESRNPDILNYLGFTLRKAGKFEEA
jgi:tetratricopeptide (TPR) repeat protein